MKKYIIMLMMLVTMTTFSQEVEVFNIETIQMAELQDSGLYQSMGPEQDVSGNKGYVVVISPTHIFVVKPNTSPLILARRQTFLRDGGLVEYRAVDIKGLSVQLIKHNTYVVFKFSTIMMKMGFNKQYYKVKESETNKAYNNVEDYNNDDYHYSDTILCMAR